MRRISLILALAVVASSAALIPARGAKTPLECRSLTEDGADFRLCSGLVVTKGGAAALDVDVRLPAKGSGPFPLITMLHGLGGSKLSYSSTTVEGEGGKFHRNPQWFASRGYAVLTFTARGFAKRTAEIGNECRDPSQQSVDAEGPVEYDVPSPACMVQLAHKRYEIKDIQYLIGRLVDGGLLSADEVRIARNRIGVYGESYGGGATWILSHMNTWRSPGGTRIKLAAAVPVIGWTDLVDALVPNGRARDDVLPPTTVAERAAQAPGVAKKSYVDGFYTILLVRGLPVENRSVPGYLKAWKERLDAGEPYDDQVIQDAINKLLANRSAYYIAKKPNDPPILAIQGFTDQVFPAIEAVRMFNGLKADDPDYPISLYAGDVGHAAAQNKDEERAYLAGLVNKWFDHYLRGRGAQPNSFVEARVTRCDDELGSLYRADDWAGLHSEAQTFEALSTAGSLTTPAADNHAGDLDPLRVSGNHDSCRTTNIDVADGNLAVEIALPDGLTMMGLPEVSLEADPDAQDMYVAARLWDVDPVAGEQTLVTRGVYRLGGDALQTVVLQLQGNGWTFAADHLLKLELTADDSPSFRRSNAAGDVVIDNVSLEIPVADPAALVP